MEQADIAIKEARTLLQTGFGQQGVINRAYYVMFYDVLALLQERKITPRKHKGAIEIFHREFVRTGELPRELAKSLARAFDLRQESDYRFLSPFSESDLTTLISEAETFVESVRRVLTGGSAPTPS